MMSDHDSSTDKGLRDKYAIVGIGETGYVRGSGRTTRSLSTEAVRAAIQDAGLTPGDIDGMLSYQSADSTFSNYIAGDLGIRLNFHLDMFGGGSSVEALVGVAIGLIEARLCRAVVIYRGMNGYSELRFGGTGQRAALPVNAELLHTRTYGWHGAGPLFSPAFMRHMHDHGTRPEQAAMVKVIQSEHASNNPRALHRKRLSVDDVLSSRMICKPLHLLDCCLETDNGTAFVVTSAERAGDLRHPSVLISAVVGRVSKPRSDNYYQFGPISSIAGEYGRERLWAAASISPDDVDVTGAYDAFTFTALMQLEAYGFCKRGEAGDYVSSGATRLGGLRPNNTSGGQLNEGYTHGMNLIMENVRQLRHDADDSCPLGPDGRRIHTHDHREGGCRQIKDAEIAANLGWATPGTGSALVLRRG